MVPFHRVFHFFLLIVISILFGNKLLAQNTVDSLISDSSMIKSDTNESRKVDPISEDSLADSGFSSKVEYFGEDSIILENATQKAYLYGNAWVKYEDIELQAAIIEVDFKRNLVVAKGVADTNNNMSGTPVFKEKGQEYKAGEMVYNFNTRKGIIRKANTQEGEGFVHGDKVKMSSENVFYIRDGKYTTCSLEHPHFYISAKKLKIINNDKIITGPANIVIEDVPTFLAIPFGFFPNRQERRSGIILPSYGNSPAQGFFLQNGGYYWAISENFDLTVQGDIYTNTSWALNGTMQYKKRYKHRGVLQVSYQNVKDGEPDTPIYTKLEDFFVTWNHNQDPKARPLSSFNASVRMGSSNYFQNNINTSANDFIRNEFNSNVTFSKRFRNTPFTLSLNGSHSQNNQDTSISFVLPNVNLTMNRIFPLKRKIPVGKERFYERIGVTYNTQFRNTLNAKTYEIFGPDTLSYDPQLLERMRNGFQHNINTNFSVKLGPVAINPGFRWKDVWYLKTERDGWSNEDSTTFTSDVFGFQRFGEYDANASITTKLYGMYSFNKGRLKAIRHTITPSLTVNYTPDQSDLHPEWFYTVQVDTNGREQERSIFDGGIFGSPTDRESAVIGFNLQNIVESKRIARNDSTNTPVVGNILEAWNFTTSYDVFKDSNNLAPLRMDIRTSIKQKVNIRIQTTHDFYAEDSREFQYAVNGNPLRLTNLNFNVGVNLRAKPKSKIQRNSEWEKARQEQEEMNSSLPETYFDFNVPWSLRINYSLRLTRSGETENVTNSLDVNGDINLTPNWKLTARTTYDFDLNKLGFTVLTVSRDLHCWQINFNVTPFGSRTNFTFDIMPKASILQDLKLTRRRSWYDLN